MSHYYISSRLANALAGTQDPNEIYHLLMRRGTAKIRRAEPPTEQSSEGRIEDAPEPIPESIPESTEPLSEAGRVGDALPPEEEQQN